MQVKLQEKSKKEEKTQSSTSTVSCILLDVCKTCAHRCPNDPCVCDRFMHTLWVQLMCSDLKFGSFCDRLGYRVKNGLIRIAIFLGLEKKFKYILLIVPVWRVRMVINVKYQTRTQESWVQFLILPQTSCVIIGKSFNLSLPQFPVCKIKMISLSHILCPVYLDCKLCRTRTVS